MHSGSFAPMQYRLTVSANVDAIKILNTQDSCADKVVVGDDVVPLPEVGVKIEELAAGARSRGDGRWVDNSAAVEQCTLSTLAVLVLLLLAVLGRAAVLGKRELELGAVLVDVGLRGCWSRRRRYRRTGEKKCMSVNV